MKKMIKINLLYRKYILLMHAGFLFTFLLCLPSCSQKKISSPLYPTVTEKAKDKNLEFISELDEVKAIEISGGTAIALIGNHLMKITLSEEPKSEVMNLNLPLRDREKLQKLISGSNETIWVGGENILYRIEGDNIIPVDEVKLNIKKMTFLGKTKNNEVFVGGDNILLSFKDDKWKVKELPFTITGGISAGEKVFLMTPLRGIVKIEGDKITEYPNPLIDFEPFRSRKFAPLSAVVNKGNLWVLWSGMQSYISVLYPSEEWDTYVFPPQIIGMPVALWGVGTKIFLETDQGFFEIIEGGKGGITKLLTLTGTKKAKKLMYKLPSHDYFEKGIKYKDIGQSMPKPVPTSILPRPALSEKEEGKTYSLVPISFPSFSDVTAVNGFEDTIMVGTKTMGIMVSRSNSPNWNELYTYNAKPSMPLGLALTSDESIMYPLENGKIGIISKEGNKELKIGHSQNEKCVGIKKDGENIYAITLAPSEDRIGIYELKTKGFVKAIERTVDLATGIGGIGGFDIAGDGTFWFTVKSFGEGQEMGACEIRPKLGTLILNGAIPIPPEYALIMPNGVSSLKIGKDNNVYLGGMDGLIVIKPDRSIKKFQEPEGLVGDYVTDIAIDSSGRVWILTVEALGYLQDEKLVFPTALPYRNKGASCIGTDNKGRAILVDEDGLKVFEGNEWKLLLPRSSIPGSPVNDVQGDEKGNIWIVTGRCITIFKEKN